MPLKVVFDTSIFISVVLSPTGKPFQCTALAKRNFVQSVTCLDILEEFREKLVNKLDYAPSRAEAFLQEIIAYSELVSLPHSLKIVEADPDDDIVVECAAIGNANDIITGDRHLLTLSSFQGISIVKASDFLNSIGFD